MSHHAIQFLRTAMEFCDQLELIGDEMRLLPVQCLLRRIYALLSRRVAELQPSTADAKDWERATASGCICNPVDTDDWDQVASSQPTLQEPSESLQNDSFAPSQLSRRHVRPSRPFGGPNSISNSPLVNSFRKAIGAIVNSTGPVYVDVQWLRSDRGEIIKEFAATTGTTPTAWIMVKSPEDASPIYQDTRYAIDNLHGISWEDGDIDVIGLRILTRGLFRNGRQIYCKGEQKIEELVKKLDVRRDQITSLDELPKLSYLESTYGNATNACQFHRNMGMSSFSCSMRRVNAMAFYNEAR